MKRLATAAVLAVLLAGCKGSEAPAPKAPPKGGAITTLAAQPILRSLAGQWGHNGREVVSILPQPDGSALLHVADVGEGWRVEVRGARIEQGKVLYDQYHYVKDSPNHPLDGVRCEVVLEPIPAAPNKLKMTMSSEQSQPKSQLLSRLP